VERARLVADLVDEWLERGDDLVVLAFFFAVTLASTDTCAIAVPSLGKQRRS
jgi:hypothetical protein